MKQWVATYRITKKGRIKVEWKRVKVKKKMRYLR